MRDRFRLRHVDFESWSGRSYLQGHGLTYDEIDVEVELRGGEEIIEIQRLVKHDGPVGDEETPFLRVWIKVPA